MEEGGVGTSGQPPEIVWFAKVPSWYVRKYDDPGVERE